MFYITGNFPEGKILIYRLPVDTKKPLSLQVIAVARTADIVIMMVDVTKGEVQQQLLTQELEAVGIRLNKNKPGIYFKVRYLHIIHLKMCVVVSQFIFYVFPPLCFRISTRFP